MRNVNLLRLFVLGASLFAIIGLTTPLYAEEAQSVGNVFIKHLQENDEAALKELVKTRGEEFPAEVQAMVEYASSPNAAPQEQDYLFQVAYMMSQMYGEHTGDNRLLAAVESNYNNVLERRKASQISPEAVAKTKKEITDMGGGDWRIVVFKMDSERGLRIDIDVKETAKSEGSLTPTISFKTGQAAKKIVQANLPDIHQGQITWSCIGVGLKTVFLE